MNSAEQLVHNFNKIILNPVIGLLFAIALLVFLWGVLQYLISGDSETARSEGGKHIMWGLIGLVVMISAFGIINIALSTFGITNSVSKEIIP